MTIDPDTSSFAAIDEAALKREKERARQLRKSQWWTNQRGCGLCYYCRASVPPRELTMDHRVPISRGGKSTRHNVVPCCLDCNRRKKFLLPVEWTEYLVQLQGANLSDGAGDS